MSGLSEGPDAPSARGSLLVAAGILLSRGAGLLRDVVLAAFLGNGPAIEAFTAAFRIPNLLQNLLGEGVLSASFIPSYSRLLAQGRTEDATKVASTVLTLLIGLTGLLVILGVVAAGPLTSVIAPGFTGARRDLTVTLVRIVTPGIGVLVASAWCLGVLNSHRRFFLSYVAPVLWNTAQIVAVLVAGLFVFDQATAVEPAVLVTDDARGLTLTLGWATVAGAALQLAVQIPQVRRLEPRLSPSLTLDAETTTVLQRLVPVVGARGVVQLSAYLDVLLATFLVVGGLASIRYASLLYLLPISIFGMSVAASELPVLSRQSALDHTAAVATGVAQRLRGALARLTYFVVPVAVAYVLAGDLVVGALLQRGQFGPDDTLQVWAILAAYALGLYAATTARLFQSALYGLGDTRTPARASLVRIAVSVVVGVVSMLQLDRVGLVDGTLEVVGDLPAFGPVPEGVRNAADTVPRVGAAGLALGVSLAAWVELRLLDARLSAVVGPIDVTGGAGRQTLIGAGAAAAATVPLRWLSAGLPVLPRGLVVLAVAAVVYLTVTRMTGFPLAAALSDRPPARSGSARRSRSDKG